MRRRAEGALTTGFPVATPDGGSGLHLLTTADGISVAVDHLPRGAVGTPRVGEPASPLPADQGLAMIVVHGFTRSRRHPKSRTVQQALVEHGAVIALDLRGHGQSGGRTTLGDTEVHDVTAALRWARELGYERVATVGFSLGSAVVLRQAALARLAFDDHANAIAGVTGGDLPDAVVAVSGPARWYYRGTEIMRRLHWAAETRTGRLLVRVARRTRISDRPWDQGNLPLDPTGSAAVLTSASPPTPVLVVHGDVDEFFPVEHAEAIALAGGGATLWLEPGMGHAEDAASPELLHRIGSWVVDAVGVSVGQQAPGSLGQPGDVAPPRILGGEPSCR